MALTNPHNKADNKTGTVYVIFTLRPSSAKYTEI